MSLWSRLTGWFRRPAEPKVESTLEPPLRPGEASDKGTPEPEPPLEQGEAAYKARPVSEPPLQSGEGAFKDPAGTPPLTEDETKRD